ncbi:hypothetical protein ABT168_18675 [Streptomyces sp. NPDC001793]|uniref:hypothetical protein n=1 Tax=Streptomyces sp. NPDC001793 TaxID=3154657 RepID=UPI003332D3B6
MSGNEVPAQPGGSAERPWLRKEFEERGEHGQHEAAAGVPAVGPLPPTPPGASEATRLLCAGTYLDTSFRDAVIDELYIHEERFAAPSLGIDAARVLAHALRARRLELGWSAAILFTWIVATVLSQGLALAYLSPVILLGLARFVRRLPVAAGLTGFVSFLMRWYARISLTLFLAGLALAAFGNESLARLLALTQSPIALLVVYFDSAVSGSGASGLPSGSGWPNSAVEIGGSESAVLFAVWVTLALPVVVAVLVALKRGQFARALARELSREHFPDMMSDPAERAEGVRFQRLRERVRTEQHGPLVMYRPGDPFCGAGEPVKPWSLSVELVPRADGGAVPLDNGEILARIVPLVEALRVPSGSPATADAVRDRLRALEVDQCVFLPVDGLPSRAAAPYAPAAFEAHRAAALEEGGETRRHFLRIRVGGWHEGVVTTVFVRVHTQGGMLMMEVAPHVLWPLRPLFQDADRIAHQYRHHHRFGKAVWALAHSPRSAGEALLTLARGLRGPWRLATEGHGAALPEGPATSVRELGATGEASLFQYMDVARYLKTVQQRVAAGVKSALHDAGYQTAEFEQRVVHVADGGVYVESAQGAVGIGDHNTITSNGDPAPRSGADSSPKGRS